MASYAGFAALAFKTCYPRMPFILTLQEGDPIKYILRRVGIFRPIFKRIFKQATIVQAISNYLAGFGTDMGYRGEVRVIPNGVDTALFAREYSDQEIGALRWELHKGKDDLFLITMSRLVVKNGVADVIRALELLPDRVKFLVLGTGELQEPLEKLADDLGVRNRVIFAGWVDHKEMPKFVKASDIFIRPSISEGMGNSFIEAMAAGIPVIATPVGGIPDFLTDGETGLFCEVHNPESIAKSVNRLLDDPKLTAALVANASAMVAERYDWKQIAERMEREVFDAI
jgi:glycosyltransferase involved in cell wall biosynthesis